MAVSNGRTLLLTVVHGPDRCRGRRQHLQRTAWVAVATPFKSLHMMFCLLKEVLHPSRFQMCALLCTAM